MCFTVNVNIVKEEMEKRFRAVLNDPESYRPSYYYHAFELPEMPVISQANPDLIQLFQWGLIPSWTGSKEQADQIRFRTFNARAETITEKPSYRKPIQSKRCLVAAKGFYEWQHRGEKKIPYYIFLPDAEMFSFAGLYDTWLDKNSGELLNTFSIITTTANSKLEIIHNTKKRMPVILSKQNEEVWLDPSLQGEKVLNLLKPIPGDLLEAYTISPLISKRGVEKNIPGLIEPYNYDSPNLFDI